MENLLTQIPWLNEITRILIYYVSAWLVSFLLSRISHRLISLGRLASKGQIKPERQKTLQGLLTGAITLFAFIAATLVSLALFIQADTLAWMVGLFSAAFGLGARPLISDYLAGLSFIFEDTFAVEEKIEVYSPAAIEGVVEAIKLRTTMLRSTTGESYVIPNGEIRTVRNFSRGKFSIANVTLRISASDIGATLNILEVLSKEALHLLPNLIEPWQIISPEGIMGEYTELTLVAKARFGKAAEMRTRMLNLIQERLTETGIDMTA